jgi:hypothetical protein
MSELWATRSYDILAMDLVTVFHGLDPSVEAAGDGKQPRAPANRFPRAFVLAGFTQQRVLAEDD